MKEVAKAMDAAFGGSAAWSATAAHAASPGFDRRSLPWLLLAPALLVIFGLVRLSRSGGRSGCRSAPPACPTWPRGRAASSASTTTATSSPTPTCGEVFLTTAVFGFACVAATMAAGLAVALLLDQRFRGPGAAGRAGAAALGRAPGGGRAWCGAGCSTTSTAW